MREPDDDQRSTVFTLEALNARYGDCLLVHFGDRDRPTTLLIDGGPAATFRPLAARLEELRSTYWGKDKLPLPVIVVTHIDADHIAGLLKLAEAISPPAAGARADAKGPRIAVGSLWHNSFEAAVAAGVEAATGEPPEPSTIAEAVTAAEPAGGFGIESVDQARRLVTRVKELGWPINQGFAGLVRAEDPGANGKIGPLSVRVLLPDGPRLAALAEEFGAEPLAEGAAPTPEDTPSNLASIVCLLELNRKTMLLTGDARDDHIVAALEDAEVLPKDKPLKVDLFKLPHHGSIRNVMCSAIFERIHADHYVISADGNDENPDVETLRLLSEARPDDRFTIHMTNAPEALRPLARAAVTAFFESERAANRRYRVKSRREGASGISIDLLAEMNNRVAH